jgi:hypothetical protein
MTIKSIYRIEEWTAILDVRRWGFEILKTRNQESGIRIPGVENTVRREFRMGTETGK